MCVRVFVEAVDAGAALDRTTAGAVCGDADGTGRRECLVELTERKRVAMPGHSGKSRWFSALRSVRSEISGARLRTCADLIQTSIFVPQEHGEIHVFCG